MAKMKEILIDVDVNRVIEANRLSFIEKENDILRRLLLQGVVTTSSPAIAAVTRLEVPKLGSRSRGQWQVKFGDEVVASSNLKDAYVNLLRLAQERDDSFLTSFASYKARSRYFVSRSKKGLYLSSPHLAEKHAIEFLPGWFVDGNLSESQVAIRARSAVFAAGLSYGTDAWIKDRGRTI